MLLIKTQISASSAYKLGFQRFECDAIMGIRFLNQVKLLNCTKIKIRLLKCKLKNTLIHSDTFSGMKYNVTYVQYT